MNWIQLLLAVVLLVIVVYLIRARPSASHLAMRRVIVILAVIVGVVLVVWPGLLTSLAHLVGVGRGTDLLLYALVVFVLVDSVSNYKRSVNHERTTSELARQLALTEAQLDEAIENLRVQQDADSSPNRKKIAK